MELASLQTAFLTLDEAIKTTNRRVNALDSVVKPMLENTIAYIKVRTAMKVQRFTPLLWRRTNPPTRRPTAARPHSDTQNQGRTLHVARAPPGSPGGFSPAGSGLHGKQFVLTAR